MNEFKPLAIAMALAMLFFRTVDHLGWIGQTYGSRSAAIHIIFLFFGWLGYIAMPENIKEKGSKENEKDI